MPVTRALDAPTRSTASTRRATGDVIVETFAASGSTRSRCRPCSSPRTARSPGARTRRRRSRTRSRSRRSRRWRTDSLVARRRTLDADRAGAARAALLAQARPGAYYGQPREGAAPARRAATCGCTTSRTPSRRDGEVLCASPRVGLCGSDRHWFLEGGIGDAVLERPLVLGHEFAGVVEAGPRAGERVALDPAIPCGRCALCLAGDGAPLPRLRFAGSRLDRRCAAHARRLAGAARPSAARRRLRRRRPRCSSRSGSRCTRSTSAQAEAGATRRRLRLRAARAAARAGCSGRRASRSTSRPIRCRTGARGRATTLGARRSEPAGACRSTSSFEAAGDDEALDDGDRGGRPGRPRRPRRHPRRRPHDASTPPPRAARS